MYWIYVLVSLNQRYRYVGITREAKSRLAKHNKGAVRSTAPYRPFKMVLVEARSSLADARKGEKYFKTGFGRRQLDRILSDAG